MDNLPIRPDLTVKTNVSLDRAPGLAEHLRFSSGGIQTPTRNLLKPIDLPNSPLSPNIMRNSNKVGPTVPYQVYVETRQDNEGMKTQLLDERRQNKVLFRQNKELSIEIVHYQNQIL